MPQCDLRSHCHIYHTLCAAALRQRSPLTQLLTRCAAVRGVVDQTRPQHDASAVDVVRISRRETELAPMSQASKGHPAASERPTSRVLVGDDSSLLQPNHKLLNWLWVVASCLPPAEL